MKLNRELQNAVLLELTSKFPHSPDSAIFNTWIDECGEEEVIGNILYLEMHQLITIKSIRTFGNKIPQLVWPSCQPTAKAFDFLADDGGLSAVLGVVTVKLHADTIKDLLQLRIMENPHLSEAEKTTWIERIKALSESSLEHLTLKGLDYALEHGQEGIEWLGRLLGS